MKIVHRCALIILALAVTARAQIPSLGFCPEYLPMPGFNMERFAGIWYEAERYFQLTEVASRCVMSNYTKGPDGKYHVSNEITSRFTGIKRVLEGEIRKPATKADAGKLHVKYTTVPLIPLETQYNVLETDYDNYAVLWSCSGAGPVHTQNAWIMTRMRVAPGEILQKAYGVLDKYKISKVFFVKTNQDDCAYLDNLQSEQAATEPPKKAEESAQASDAEVDADEESAPQPIAGKSVGVIRPHIVPDAPEAIIKTRKAEIEAKEIAAAALKQPIVEAPEPAVAVAEETVKTVPEVIMAIAEKSAEKLVEEPAQQQAPIQEPVIEAIKEEQPSPIKTEPVIVEEPLAPIAPVAAVSLEDADKKDVAPIPEQKLEDEEKKSEEKKE